MTHSPGPWDYVMMDSGEDYKLKDANGIAIVSGCGCCLSPWVGPNTDDREADHGAQKSNADLIAAAPDLLAALKMLLASAHDHQSGIREAEEAIAKAEGRT
jgi:hypothetical protein